MKKMLLASAVVVAILGISGCGDSPRSTEDLQKLSKAELDSMGEECVGFIYGTAFKSKEEADKQWGELEKIVANINKSRGKEVNFKDFPYSSVTNDEFSKFGNGNEFFKKMIECDRILK